jgi:hypothetical protein
MPSPGFDDPAVAAEPPGGNLYFAQDVGVGRTISSAVPELQSELGGLPGKTETWNRNVSLMFGSGTASTGSGAPIVSAASSSRGHWSEILNFHGSPAPWVLVGLLLVLGILHLQGSAGVKGGVRL